MGATENRGRWSVRCSARALALRVVVSVTLAFSVGGCLPMLECNIGADCPSGVCGPDKRCLPVEAEPEPDPPPGAPDSMTPDAGPVDALVSDLGRPDDLGQPDALPGSPPRPLRLRQRGLRWAPSPAAPTAGGVRVTPNGRPLRRTPSGLRLRGRVSLPSD